MTCELKPYGEGLLRCARCGRTVDPRVFDLASLGACLEWHTITAAPALSRSPANIRPVAMEQPPPKNLAVVACYYNFAGYRSLRDNYLRFLHEMQYWGVPLYVAELAFEDQPFVRDAFLKVRADDHHRLWQKEALLNRLVAELPRRYDAVAWIDADMMFLDREWYPRTLAALAEYPVVQLWDRWHFSDHQGKVCLTGQSVGHLGERFLKHKGHPGGAWAARRSVFPLDWCHILGGGDTIAVEAWLGIRDSFLQKQMTPPWRKRYKAWSAEAWLKVQGQVSTLPGDCLHLYHGSRTNRRYGDRSRWLQEFEFDPEVHVRLDEQGLVAWTAAAPPGLVDRVRDYFVDRKEDEGLK